MYNYEGIRIIAKISGNSGCFSSILFFLLLLFTRPISRKYLCDRILINKRQQRQLEINFMRNVFRYGRVKELNKFQWKLGNY